MEKKRGLEIVMAVLILTGAYYIGRLGAEMVQIHQRIKGAESVVSCMETMESEPSPEGKVVIDAGHGGFDSGKVAVNGILEKDINLQIAKKVKDLLNNAGMEVVMIREEDAGLSDESEVNKKQQDMKRRVEMIEASGADLAVSIHQNSYTDESVRGPQVFYYETSVKGERLAEILQDSLNRELEIIKPREKKANDTYYILKKTPVPTVIVECGFLSNPEEGDLLMTDDYQERVAKAIFDGVLTYMKEK